MKLLLIIICFTLNFQTYAQTGLFLVNTFPKEDSQIEGDYFNAPSHLEFKGESFYITDWTDDNIKIFNKNGDYIRKIGRSGKGPGELKWPQIIAVNERHSILYCDQLGGGSGINMFTLDGKFIKKANTDGAIYNIVSVGDYVFAHNLNDKENTIFQKYDKDFNLIKNFGASFFSELNVDNRNNLKNHLVGRGRFSVQGDTIYYIFLKSPYCIAFKTNGEVIRTVRLSNKKYSERLQRNVEAVEKGWNNGTLDVASVNEGGYVYKNKIYCYSKNYKNISEIIVFNLNGEQERIIEIDEKEKDLRTKNWLKLHRIIDDKFYFLDLFENVVRVFEERKL